MDEFSREAFRSETLRGLAKCLRTYKSSGREDQACDGRDLCNAAVIESAMRRKKTAGVLVCLFEGMEGELRVILTKRSVKLSSHPGDVALPGGKMDECDSDETTTAIREAMEEIGLSPSLVQVVLILEPFTSQNLVDVIPVVGVLEKMEEFIPTLNEDEVDVNFDASLDMFLKDENLTYEDRDWMGWKYVVHQFDYRATEDAVFRICEDTDPCCVDRVRS